VQERERPRIQVYDMELLEDFRESNRLAMPSCHAKGCSDASDPTSQLLKQKLRHMEVSSIIGYSADLRKRS